MPIATAYDLRTWVAVLLAVAAVGGVLLLVAIVVFVVLWGTRDKRPPRE